MTRPTQRRVSPLFAALLLACSLGVLGTVAAVEEWLIGPFGPVARLYRTTGLGRILGIVSDGLAWLIGHPL